MTKTQEYNQTNAEVSEYTHEQLQRLKQLGTATVYEAQGQRGSIASEIRPLDPAMKLVGTALTVNTTPGDNLMFHQAVLMARPGDVLVVDAKGFTDAGPWGDVLTLAAQQAGIAGLVIDGSVRDSEAIIEAGFPVFSRGISIRGTTKVDPGEVGGTINLAGTLVERGDIIIGDRDGLVVVKAADVLDSLEKAEAREAKEEEFRRRILDEGASTAELLGLLPTLQRYGW
ncbi:4-carboxy-4-hydroxy-2-oxoadipate aldolase/oxaloacetate decarboxylase [Arthrobacter sp. EpRS71]|uniref:4-carboxy-4-hydroxy-2-oxoadipate aldolase/oxaloacetate decarboxylase n=1 Tax=Arthrobacter sp. EpRS71 TaxID=1743141 RepID=UPI000747326E|nr:4-carboxy-4-hydroxy-2-oxoadipate aldolase/oxaloacetate decarboxylase [Arthrobacter sp. EpRS71]KUM36352.1 4-hydroxy-4-methyl-2-oxoglutarate aldolase [Arthrobacter sp. EpRS71]